MSVEEAIETHAIIIIDEIKADLGTKWEELPPSQRNAAERSARRLVALEWKQRTTGEDVSEDLAFVKTTIDGFKLAGEIALYDAFWKGVDKGLQALGSFLVGAGKGLVPGLGSLLAGIDLGGLING